MILLCFDMSNTILERICYVACHIIDMETWHFIFKYTVHVHLHRILLMEEHFAADINL